MFNHVRPIISLLVNFAILI